MGNHFKKKDNFYNAFDQFDIEKVSRYKQKKFDALMLDAGLSATGSK
nr:DNA-3-methyladenine glycosylase I [Niabella hibiscisoli]